MIRPSRSMVWLVAAFALALAGCGGSASGRITAPSAGTLARWNAFAHVPGVVDLSNRRHDGTISVAAAGRLALLRRGATVQPFASGPSGYSSPAGEEPYIALSTGRKLPGAGCSFGADVLYVLRLGNAPGVTAVNETGHVRSFVRLATRGLLNGIAFDTTGRFGMRLLATATAGTSTTVFAIDCHRRVSVLTRRAPKVEGGIAVAPRRSGASRATSSLRTRTAAGSTRSRPTGSAGSSPDQACRAAGMSAWRAPASCRPASVPDGARLSPTG
jgi:hypothetical protein